MPARPTNRTEQRTVADRYVLGEQLGRGGMGTVWRAHDELLQRTVALKEIELPLTVDQADRDALKARIMREARSAAALSHPNVVTMFDVIEEGGHAYIVMEYIDARSLSEIISERGRLTPQQAAHIGLGILGALEAAHSAGIVHRDVKPSNVMVEEGTVKLADFGIATVKGDPKITQTGLILGSPSYMAPEQARSEPAGPETDLWGLGVTLYTAVQGTGPFERGEPIPTLTAILHDEPARPTDAGPLAPVIMRMLEKEPTDRPGIPEVRRALQDVSAGATSATTLQLEDPITETEVERPAYADEPRTARPVPAPRPVREERRSWGWLVAVAAVLLALAALIWLPGLLRDEPASDTAPDRDRAQAPAQQDENDDDQDQQAEPAPDEGGNEGAPEGWELYTDPSTGYRIAHPADWSVERIDTRTDFTAPNGDYLRVDYTTSPGSTQEDHVQAWEAQSESFAAEYGDYEEIGIDGTDFRGWPGALWEYTYSGRHAYNLGFTASPDYGFALNLVTSEGSWGDLQDEWEAFKASFQPPG